MRTLAQRTRQHWVILERLQADHSTDRTLCQRDGLEGADDVVGAGFGKEAFVEARAQIPVIALVIFVAIKTPDPADDDDATDAIVPEIAQVMETEVSTSVGAFEAGVIVNDDLRQP